MKCFVAVAAVGVAFMVLHQKPLAATKAWAPYVGVSLYEWGSFPLLDSGQTLFDATSHEFSVGLLHSVFKEPKKRKGKKRRLKIPGGIHVGGEAFYAIGQVGDASQDSFYKVGGRLYTGKFALMALWYVGVHGAYGNADRGFRNFAEYGLDVGAGITTWLAINASVSYFTEVDSASSGFVRDPVAFKVNFLKFLFPLSRGLLTVETEEEEPEEAPR